jgi:hypothetical protein
MFTTKIVSNYLPYIILFWYIKDHFNSIDIFKNQWNFLFEVFQQILYSSYSKI